MSSGVTRSFNSISFGSLSMMHCWPKTRREVLHRNYLTALTKLAVNKRAQLACIDQIGGGGYRAKHDLRLSAEQIGNVPAAIRHMNQLDTGVHFEEFAKDMGYGPVAGRSHIELARIGF